MAKKNQYKIINKLSELINVIDYAKQTKYFSFDFETSSTDYYEPDAYPLTLNISFQPGFSYILPLGHYESPFKNNYPMLLHILGNEIFENKEIVKVAWNIKFEMGWLMKYGIYLLGYSIDGMLAKYVLRETRPNDLKSMVAEYYPEYGGYEKKLEESKRKHGSWAAIPLKDLAEYGSIDSDLTLRLANRFERKIIELGFYPLFRNLIMPMNIPLGHAQFKGIPVDKPYLVDLEKHFKEEIQKAETALYGMRVVKRYNKYRKKSALRKLITTTKREIEELEAQLEEEETLSKQSGLRRQIANRNAKVQNYISGVVTTGKERKLVEDFNFGSSDQMIDFLFTSKRGLGLDVVEYTVDKKTKKKSKRPSVAEDVILKLKDQDDSGFMQGLLDLRALNKSYSTNVKGILERLSSHSTIHTRFHIHGTVTGRLSSSDPNMQNIPRVTTDPRIKKMFKAPPGYVILELDYSQAELRVVAELAKETEMIEWFRTGRNIHVAVACKAEDADYDEVYPITKDKNHPKYDYWTRRKKRAKTINFGILYEQQPPKLAETLNSNLQPGQKPYTIKEAEKFKREWFEMFPKVGKWIDKQHKLAKKQGYIKTLFGRKRRLPDIYSDSFGKFLEAQRQSVNAPIQSIASDFTQFSGILIWEQRLQRKLPLCLQQIYTVHDSIGFIVKPEYIHEIVPKLIEICNDPETKKWFGFKMKYVKMKVSIEVGKRWSEIEDYDPNKDYSLLIAEDTI